MNRNFWKDKIVFITGHTGFKGSWLSLWLKSLGANVVGYSLPSATDPSLFKAADISTEITSIEGDIRDLESLDNTITKHRPEIVIHMAAQALVRASYDDPIETYSTNVMGTANILEVIRNSNSVKSAVIITSDKCYENNEWIWGYRENDAMGGHDPYSSSKGCAELVTSAYIRSFFNVGSHKKTSAAIATARAGNVIGGGDWSKDRLVPDIMNSIIDGKPVIIRSPNSIRPWQHVLEPLRGYLMLAESLYNYGDKFSGAWNFGPEDQDAKKVSWIVDFLTKNWGNGAAWVLDSKEHPHEATYLKLDCTKAKQLLGWHPIVKLPIALQWIVEWYQKFIYKRDIQQCTIDQINRYESAIEEELNDC